MMMMLMMMASTLASFGMTTFWLWFFAKFVLPVDAPARLPYLQVSVLGFHVFVRVRPHQASISSSELKHFFLEKVIPVFVRVSAPPRIFK